MRCKKIEIILSLILVLSHRLFVAVLFGQVTEFVQTIKTEFIGKEPDEFAVDIQVWVL